MEDYQQGGDGDWEWGKRCREEVAYMVGIKLTGEG